MQEAEAADDQIPEKQNAYAALEEDNRKMKKAMIFLSNKKNYSPEQLEAVQIPKQKLAVALSGLAAIDRRLLASIGLPGLELPTDHMEELAMRIRNLACVPLEVNYPNKVQRDKIVTGIEGYDELKSHIIVCYKEVGELLFHVKDKEVIEVFN